MNTRERAAHHQQLAERSRQGEEIIYVPSCVHVPTRIVSTLLVGIIWAGTRIQAKHLEIMTSSFSDAATDQFSLLFCACHPLAGAKSTSKGDSRNILVFSKCRNQHNTYHAKQLHVEIIRTGLGKIRF